MTAQKQNGWISSLPFFKELDYNDVLEVERLRERGADVTLVYFWFNITHGSYRLLHRAVLERDRIKFIHHYPTFEQDIIAWKPKPINHL